MALVRCPKHHIPYNPDNPRGCPACAREKEGSDSASVMQELARASRSIAKPELEEFPAPPAEETEKEKEKEKETEAPKERKQTLGDMFGGVRKKEEAPPPPSPPPQEQEKEKKTKASKKREQTLSEMFAGARKEPAKARQRAVKTAAAPLADRIRDRLPKSKVLSYGIPAVALMAGFLIFTSGPEFIVEPHPADFAGTPRPLPVEPGSAIEAVFSALGIQPPQPNPDFPQLEPYSYGTELTIDAFNGFVYAITYSLPNRAWRGIRVGASEQRTMGSLALLGTVTESGNRERPAATQREGYTTYLAVSNRPTVTLTTQVRPPNGCFDVSVDMQPKVIGLLIDGDTRYAAVARAGAAPEWVSSRVRVVNRAVSGPYAGARAC